MMRFWFLVPVLCILAACQFSLDELNTMRLEGKDFKMALAREYRMLAHKKAALAGWWDADIFAQKGLRAAKGFAVEPERVEDWDIPEEHREQLVEARRTLLSNVTGQAMVLSPEVAARAFARYDCWMEEAENNIRPSELESCRSEFFETLNYLSVTQEAIADKPVLEYSKVEQEAVAIPRMDPYKPAAVIPLPSPEDAAAMQPKSMVGKTEVTTEKRIEPRNYVILFGASSTTLSAEGMKVADGVVKALEGFTQYEVILNGHTDASEIAADAMQFSRRRAEAVRDYLVKKGIDNGKIQLYGFGESDPVNPAADGKRHPENRRVQVFIQ